MQNRLGGHQAVRPVGANIKVVGVGGGGSNAVNRMIEAGVNGVEFIAMNTDRQALDLCLAPQKVALGQDLTKGLGAGGDPETGKAAAEETRNEIKRCLQDADMVFITAGMGGGTGTGGAPVVAEVSQQLGALTVAVVTRPFTFEGPRRALQADLGIDELQSKVDTVIVVPNDRLLTVGAHGATLQDAFRIADEVLRQGVQGISDIITIPGDINVDFADVESTMRKAGAALMGIGEADGERRAMDAAEQAVASPLLETSIEGAKRVLLNITSGPDLTLDEANAAASYIRELCDAREARIIFGWVLDPAMEGRVRVTLLATGFEGERRSATPQREEVSARPTPHVSSRQLDKPPLVRQAAPVSVQTILEERPDFGDAVLDLGAEDDLDTPAFLRRR